MTHSDGSWWSRPAGGREVLRLALPLILSTASWALMHFVDRLFLLWHSPSEMAAALPSGTLMWTLMALPLGIASYVNTFVAQYHGSGQPDRIGPAVRQGLIVGWGTTPLFLLLIPFSPLLFRLMGHDGTLARQEAIYFQVNCLGAGAAVVAAAYSAFFTGRGQTMVVMWIDITASAVDAVLNWVWIFGKWGFPEWGIAGAAAATVVAQLLKLVIYGWLLHGRDLRAYYGFDRGPWFQFDLLRRLLKFGFPNGIQMMLEGLAFTIFVLRIGVLGTLATAATTLAFSINIVAFVPMMGIGIAVSTLVGNYLGADRPDLAARATRTALAIGLAYNAFFALLYVGAPGAFLYFHAMGADGTDFESIRGLAVVLLRFVAAYCLFDATQLIYASAIKGAGDTRFVLVTTLSVSLSAMVVGQLGVWWADLGLMWWWTVLVLWIVVLAIVYVHRFRAGKWRSMRVIEPTEEGPAGVGPPGVGPTWSQFPDSAEPPVPTAGP